MTVYAQGSQQSSAYVKETTYGTTPSTPTMLRLRCIRNGLTKSKSEFTSEERRSDAQVAFVRHGRTTVAGAIECELSWLALKDWLRASLRYSTALGRLIATIDASGNTLTWATSDDSLTRASGSWVTDGAVVGAKVRVTSGAINAGIFTLSAVTASKLSFVENVSNETVTTGTHVFEAEYAENGTTETAFSVERAWSDVVQYEVSTGVKITSAQLTLAADGIAKITFNCIGKSYSISAVVLDASVDDVDTTEPMDAYTGTMTEGGSASTILRSLDMTWDWSRQGLDVLGSSTIVEQSAGRLMVTGNLTAYFTDATLHNKFLNETTSSLRILLQDPSGNQFNLYLPLIKYTSSEIAASGDEVANLAMNFHAYYDPTTGKTVQLNMTPATAAA